MKERLDRRCREDAGPSPWSRASSPATIEGMNNQASTPHDQQPLHAGTHELQRAAGTVLEYAGAADDPATLGVALAHI
jgi:hypothetical protein